MVVEIPDSVDECPGFFFLGSLEYLFGGSRFVDQSFVHVENAAGDVAGEIHFMGDDQQGRLEQAQDILIKTLKMKFASVPSRVISRIRAIHTKETADKLFEQAFTCVSLEEFEKELEAVTDN